MIAQGQLIDVTFEVLSSDPAGNVQGRFWLNTTSSQVKMDSGAVKRAFLLNDAHAVLGNDGTANNNIRLHRGAASVLQFVLGGDTTTEGTLATSLAQLSSRIENYTDAGKPAAGNAGRLAWITDQSQFKADDGSAWSNLLKVGTKGDLLTFSTVPVALPIGLTNGFALLVDNTQSAGMKWGAVSPVLAVRSVTSTDTATNADDILELSGASFTQNLFTAVGNQGKVLRIKHNGTSVTQKYTLDPAGSETIGGQASLIMYGNGEELVIYSDNANWKILSHYATVLAVTANTTLVVPAGRKQAKVLGAGAGGGAGGGGGSGSGVGGAGGGGGGAGEIFDGILQVTEGETLTLTLGTGGSAGAAGLTGATGGTGGNGSASTLTASVSAISLSLAGGFGGGGGGGSSSNPAAGATSTFWTGGTAAALTHAGGGGGAASFSSYPVGLATANGGAGSSSSTNAGSPATFGGGGGGSSGNSATTQAGGAGGKSQYFGASSGGGSLTGGGGGGGGGGGSCLGVGATGGAANAGTPGAGNAGGANTGAGGGGGAGKTGAVSAAGALGGAGGSGVFYITWM